MMKQKDPTATPMMRQYLSVKEQYPDALLFYRMGDFYEMFFDDAEIASQDLDLTLTSRNKNSPDPIPMCGVPHHAALGYVAKLIEKGHKVAICEQMEDPTKVKGLVKREVVRVITPGVVLEEENLDTKANNFLAAVCVSRQTENVLAAAVAVLDASTYEFKGTRFSNVSALAGELFRLEPREILVPIGQKDVFSDLGRLLPGCCITLAEDEVFSADTARKTLCETVGEKEASEIVDEDPLLAQAAGAAAAYVRSTRPKDILPISRFVHYDVADHLIIDEATKSHLELTKTLSGEKRGSLLWLIDKTRTGMGGRLLRNWINYPLTDVGLIRRRLDRVDLYFTDSRFRKDVLDTLSHLGDIERLAARIGLGAVTPRDLGVLRNSLQMIPELDDLLTSCPLPDADHVLGPPLDRALEVADSLTRALVDDPPVGAKEGGIFREGWNGLLDELVTMVRDAKDFISNLETRERQRTGIASLKVSFNKVFGYYIEVTRANLKNVPGDYVRKQTLATGERYVTEELEKWEARVLSADERRRELEADLFHALVEELSNHVPRLLALAGRLAEIDCSASLAEVARERDFVRPHVDDKGVIEIHEGRHPIVEALNPESPFVPNDVHLHPQEQRLLIVTGPNMAGKSTVMRQVALIVILAQMGSFIPAAQANVGVCDRLFTRVGASDNIARGASTFMVEMNETADILRHATADSLVILDEVGRGTSTYDGLSIAWAVGEYLHDATRCKVMFATHYHELIDLGASKDHAGNYHVAAREYGDQVVFLRKLVQGGTSHSFGIQVAKMAGLPETVILRAKEVLRELEEERPSKTGMGRREAATRQPSAQLDLFAPRQISEVVRVLKEIDVDRVTPIEALGLLSRLREMVK